MTTTPHQTTREEISGEVIEALERRAADAEHRLYSFRQHRAANSRQLAAFIKERAPELWPDYAAVSVNGAAHYNDVPNYDRELNILQHRAEKAEEEATKLRAALQSPTDREGDRLLREIVTFYDNLDRPHDAGEAKLLDRVSTHLSRSIVGEGE